MVTKYLLLIALAISYVSSKNLSMEPSSSIRGMLHNLTHNDFSGIYNSFFTEKPLFQDLKDESKITDTIFDENFRYKGDWTSNEKPNPFDNKFERNKGEMLTVMFTDKKKNILRMRFLDGYYLDQLMGYIEMDLSNSTYVEANGTMAYHNDTNITVAWNLGNNYADYLCDLEATFTFTNKNTGKPWGENDKLHEDLQTDMKLISKNKPNPIKPSKCGFEISSTITEEVVNITWPLIYVIAIFVGAAMNILSVYILLKDDNYYYLFKISPTSLAIQMCLDFQFFGFNMLLGLQLESNYFEYLTLASICLFFGVLVKMRLAFIAVRFQHNNNPHINDRSCANPVISFAIKVQVGLSVFYIASFFVMMYQWYTYYLLAFFLFPVFQIWMAAKLGTRKVLRWQYQLLMWPPTQIIPIFTRGYDNNFLQLTPNILVCSIVMPSMVGVFFFYQVLQHVFGPRFFQLSCFFPAPHKYLTSIKDMKAKNLNTDHDCPICYGALEEDPTAEALEDNEQPLHAKPLKKCMITPCKHYYHPSCQKQWMDQKMECPTCRAELPPY